MGPALPRPLRTDTETCLRIGGYIRYDVGFGDVRSYDGAITTDVRTGEVQGTWRNNTRFTFKTWTRQETELGALRTYTENRVNFGNRNAYPGPDSPQNYGFNSGVKLTSAWFQLGGLRVGKDHSPFDTLTGYAGNVLITYSFRTATSIPTWPSITSMPTMAFRLWFHLNKGRV